MSGADTALRELLIAAGEWHGLEHGLARATARRSYDAALTRFMVELDIPNPSAVLKSLGWRKEEPYTEPEDPVMREALREHWAERGLCVHCGATAGCGH